MSLELSFKDVCAMVKTVGDKQPKLVEEVDRMMGFALVCAPVAVGASVAALLPTLGVKNELTKLGKSAFDKFSNKGDDDYIIRHQTMQAVITNNP